LEQKYGGTPWFTANRDTITATRTGIDVARKENAAEELYAQATKLFETGELFDLKDILIRLKTGFPDSAAVSQTDRTPSFAEMEKAVAGLGKRLVVRLDGKGNFKSIQAAIDAATANSIIEIQDDGPYYEKITVPDGKEGLWLRGAKNCWPKVMSGGPIGAVAGLVTINGKDTTVERLAIIHREGLQPCLGVTVPCRLRFVIWTGDGKAGKCHLRGGNIQLHGCCDAAWGSSDQTLKTPIVARDTMWLFNARLNTVGNEASRFENCVINAYNSFTLGESSTVQSCTVLGPTFINGERNRIIDSILVGDVTARVAGNSIERSVIHDGTFVERAQPGPGCFGADPLFVDEKERDLRLKPTSPCRGRATDGGDLGVRYTAEMAEILGVYVLLRQQGLINLNKRK
jgi:hypothetical protein